jgi:S-adenosylmethionine synthetase
MNQHAEYVSPGHPDRLADAIAESIATASVRQKPDALVGVEVAVHTDCVFIDGRIAAGAGNIDIEKIVRDVYRAAGYGGQWKPDPGKIRVTTNLCQEVLSVEESDIRPFSDDQNIVIGYACGDERTNYLPAAHWVSRELGRRLFARLRRDADLSVTFGPDFKVLASLEVKPRETKVEWRRLILSVQHIPKLSCERQHRILLPLLEQILRDLEASGVEGTASTFASDKLILNGAGEFAVGGPEGATGFRERSSLSTITARACRSAGARFLARIPTRWTSVARCAPASWPRNSFAEAWTKPA